jgi:hypothetical protein
MEKNELRYFMLFFAFVTALIFSGGKFSLLVFVFAILAYAMYFLAIYTAYRFLRKGVKHAVQVYKKLHKKVSEIMRRLGSS